MTTLADLDRHDPDACTDPACTSPEHLPDPDGDTIWTAWDAEVDDV